MDVRDATHRLVTSEGGDVDAALSLSLSVGIAVTAHANGDTQHAHRCTAIGGICQQGGRGDPRSLSAYAGGGRAASPDEALELVAAPNCPIGTMDVLLMPDQMILQIHESIGHPLELDRILGDERNFAGTSFVTPRHVRQLSLRLRAAQHHVRPDARRGARELRVATTTGAARRSAST